MRLFVSYAHVDWQFTEKLANRLKRFHEVWYDDWLHAGQDWWETILYHIDWCDCFIYVVSPESQASKYCQLELQEAKRLTKQIIPLLMQSNISLPYDLERIQYANFAERIFEDAMIDLIGDLGQLALHLQVQPSQPKKLASQPTPAPQTTAASGKAFNPAEIYRDARKAYEESDFETALRLANTLIIEAPRFLPEKVENLLLDAEVSLEREARHKEYLREYQQVALLAEEDFTLDAAQQLWLKLREDYPDIEHDPEHLAERIAQVQGKSKQQWQFVSRLLEAETWKQRQHILNEMMNNDLLQKVELSHANLEGAALREANLEMANLKGATLWRANG